MEKNNSAKQIVTDVATVSVLKKKSGYKISISAMDSTTDIV